MRRLNLSTKMLVAAFPLILAVAALLALTVRSDLAEIDRADSGAELGGMWQPLITALNAIEAEADAMDTGGPAIRQATDVAINDLRDAATVLGAAEAAGDHITSSRASLATARRNLEMASISTDLDVEVDPAEAYAQASRELVSVGQLLPSEAGDPELGRELLAVVKLAEAKLAANGIVDNIGQWQVDGDLAQLRAARDDFAELSTVLGEFEAIAPDDWATQFRQAGFTMALNGFRSQLDQVVRDVQAGQPATYDLAPLETLIDGGVQFQTAVSNSIVERSETDVADARSATLRRIGIALVATLLAGLLAWLISRSITKRIRAVADGANRVATEQLPALVEALQDPRGQESLPVIEPIPARGDDELAELAAAFNSMQDTVVNVADEQVEVLRRGVSDIFVTMARRNRSLIDRQLALLDEFEAEVDDPAVLANYYQLDHMATRMRRNSESLLVLANAEPKRRRVKATEVDDVVRAAIGEVEDYRRIEIEALESLQVRGNVVADVSHLLAELLDNATAFSPPDSFVRVGGRLTDNGYMLRIVDSGVGISGGRLRELNQLLREPPVVGLSVESTLGMSVVSLLANKHNISVTLAAGNPGLIVDVVLPQSLFGPIDAQQPMGASAPVATGQAAAYTPAPSPVDQPAIVAWDDADTETETADESFEQIDPYQPVADTATPGGASPGLPIDDDRPVVAGDWRKMSLNLTAFQNGMRSANGDEPPIGNDAAPAAAPDAVAAEVAPTVPVSTDVFEHDTPAPTAPDEPTVSTDVFEHDTPAPTAPDEPTVSTDVFEQAPTAPDEPTVSTDVFEHDTPAPTAPDEPTVSTDVFEQAPTEQINCDAHAAPTPNDAMSAAEPTVDEPATEPLVVDDEPVFNPTPEPTASSSAMLPDLFGDRPEPEPVVDEEAEALALAEALAAVEQHDRGFEETRTTGEIDESTPGTTDGDEAEPVLPPPASRVGEFDVPPAPPLSATSPSQRPVTPDTARPAPHPPVPTRGSEPTLPTRSPGHGPDGGPDRLAATNNAEAQTVETPALETPQLEAPQLGTPAIDQRADTGLPSRSPGQGPDGGPDRLADSLAQLEEPPSTAPPVDPDALRNRLRAFQAEFRSASEAESGPEQSDHTGGHDHLDLGGDRR